MWRDIINSEKFKQILIIIGFVLVVIGIGFSIYWVFFRPGAAVFTNQNRPITNGLPVPANSNVNRTVTGSNTNTLPLANTSLSQPSDVANGSTTYASAIENDQSSGLMVVADSGNIQYYDELTGKFYRLSPDGTTKTLMTEDVYPGVNKVDWAPDGNQAILGFPDGNKVLYNFETKKQTTLPKELNEFSWSPESDKIVSKYLDRQNSDNQWLIVSQPDGSQSQTAEHLGDNADKVITGWSPNNQIIAAYPKGTDIEQMEVIFLGANGENFSSATIYGRGYNPNWSPDGQRLLYSTYSSVTSDNPHLYMMNGTPDIIGSGMMDLGLNTRADKCTFNSSGNTIYCAVPYYMNPGSGPQPELSTGIPDNIYQIDLRSGTTSLIARPVDQDKNQRFSIDSLQVAPAGDYLYFTDATTGTIQRIKLR